MKEYLVIGALMYFSDGTRRRANFQTKTTDLERFRESIKVKYNAEVVRLEYEEEI